MEVGQAKDPNVDKRKECLVLKLEINSEHITTRMRKLIKQLPRLTVQNNVLYRKFFEHNGEHYSQTVIPEQLKPELLCRLHDQMQHAGIQKCVTEVKVLTEPISLEAKEPGKVKMVDLVGPFPPSGPYTQFLTTMDVFSRLLFTASLVKVDAQSVARALLNIMKTHSYIPSKIISDKET